MTTSFESYRAAVVSTVYTDQDGADEAGLDAPDNTPIACAGKTTAYVSAAFSASGATLDVFVLLYSQAQGGGATADAMGLASPGVQTVTATTVAREADASGDYYGPVVAFDLAGAAFYEVRTADASSGTRTVTTWAV